MGSIGPSDSDVQEAGASGESRPPDDLHPNDADDPNDCSGAVPGRSPIRRLTRSEYNRTIFDLLGDASNPADAFPPEEQHTGFDNNADVASVDPGLADHYRIAAEEIADRAVAGSSDVFPCSLATGDDACARQFIEQFGKRAWRRPLASDEIDGKMSLFRLGRDRTTGGSFSSGIRLVIESMLQSPHFLYRVEFGVPSDGDVVPLDGWERASRLSYLLWGSMPDEALFDAAEQGSLDAPEGIEREARRMLEAPRARDAVREFYAQLLSLRRLDKLEKDATLYPDYSPAMAALFREESLTFVERVIFEGPGDLETLLTAPYSYVNGELAAFYGLHAQAGDSFERVELDPARSAGLLTQASLMSVFAKANETSPVHRGKFVREQLLCNVLPPPPNDPDKPIVPPAPDPDATTRERFSQHRDDPVCSSCHVLMDPIGFGFEHFDPVGRWRDEENGLSIDASGELVSTDVDGTFDGVADLARRLAKSEQVRECTTKQWFRFGFGRQEQEADVCTVESLERKFADSGYDIGELLVAIATSDAFMNRRQPETE